jgi:lipopolysaccharide transport system permease protein
MKESQAQPIEYTSSYRLDAGYCEVFKFYTKSILKYKQFVWANFVKNFRASYEQSFLRIVWKVILPLVPVSVYVALQFAGVLRGTTEMPKVLYVVVGMTYWQLFSSSLVAVMNAPQRDSAMLKKMSLPFVLFYISNVGEVVFDYLIRTLLIWCLLLYLGTGFQVSWLVLPLLFIPFVLFATGVGIFLSFFSIFFGDVKNIVDIFIRYGLFVSGVIFPIPYTTGFGSILLYNPVYVLIDSLRNYLVLGSLTNFNIVLGIFALIVLLIVFVLKRLYSLEPRLREFL